MLAADAVICRFSNVQCGAETRKPSAMSNFSIAAPGTSARNRDSRAVLPGMPTSICGLPLNS
jgi:hypothetical protein